MTRSISSPVGSHVGSCQNQIPGVEAPPPPASFSLHGPLKRDTILSSLSFEFKGLDVSKREIRNIVAFALEKNGYTRTMHPSALEVLRKQLEKDLKARVDAESTHTVPDRRTTTITLGYSITPPDHYTSARPLPTRPLRKLCIPTTSGTGSCSPKATAALCSWLHSRTEINCQSSTLQP